MRPQLNITEVFVSAIILLSVASVLSWAVAAHGDEHDEHPEESEASGGMLDESVRHNTSQAIIYGSLAIGFLVITAAIVKNAKKRGGKPAKLPRWLSYVLFFSIAAVVVAVTAYVAGSTIYLNVVSSTGGPVHWHADFEVWNCGQAVDLVNPQGLSNKVGSAVMHEHSDNRIHVEGVIVDTRDASIGKFLEVVGGELKNGWLAVPTASGMVTMKDGDPCNSDVGKLQVFVWKTVDGAAVQEKLRGYYDGYVISPYSQIPPGDCIIFEFDSQLKDKTGHICESYKVAMEKGAVNGG